MSAKKNLQDFFYNMKTAFFILLGGLILYLVFLDEEGAFTKKFTHFGPSDDAEFINMKLNTWPKVITVYAIGFFTSLLISYYNTVSDNFIHLYLWNPAYTDPIPLQKEWTILITVTEQIIFSILMALQFFITMTTRLQFIIPAILGRFVTRVPFTLMKIQENKFIK